MSRYINVLLGIGAFMIAPAISLAGTNASCTSLCPSSYDTMQKAADLFTDVQRDARISAHRAFMVQASASAGNTGGVSNQLLRIRAEVNRMTRRINELQAMGTSIAPWEQSAVQQATALVSRISAETDNAIGAVNTNGSAYRSSIESLNAEASALANLMKTDAHEARVYKRAAYLQPNLGMTELYR